ncbi:hypothetical protein TNCV_2554251 [Trichonephila clavipes]|nr:hypothetical protein TNCV_2554251 [Trichonephila clavipes]
MLVVSHSFAHHTSDSTFWLSSALILRKNTLEVVKGLPLLFPFHQPHKRTSSLMAIESTPMPQRHYTSTNIHALAGIRTQAQWHSSQRQIILELIS